MPKLIRTVRAHAVRPSAGLATRPAPSSGEGAGRDPDPVHAILGGAVRPARRRGPGAEASIRVAAGVSPGDPKPEWTLDAMETVVLAALLNGLVQRAPLWPRPADPTTPPLLIRGAATVLPGCRELRLYAGEMLACFDAGDRRLVDPGDAVRAWLLESARHRLSPAAHRSLVEATRAEGAGRRAGVSPCTGRTRPRRPSPR